MLSAILCTLALAAQPNDLSPTLLDARKLAEELRYEEAVVEYQRYLGEPQRPAKERARALLELGFLHFILGDEVNAERRAMEALEMDDALRLPPGSPVKQQQFLDRMRSVFAERPTLVLDSRSAEDGLEVVRAKLRDPKKRVGSVLIRHALTRNGPFYSSPMQCEAGDCRGSIPPPSGSSSFTAFYYVEALDPAGNTVASAAGPSAPLEVSISSSSSWYASPWVWGGASAAVVAAAAVFFIASAPPAR